MNSLGKAARICETSHKHKSMTGRNCAFSRLCASRCGFVSKAFPSELLFSYSQIIKPTLCEKFHYSFLLSSP